MIHDDGCVDDAGRDDDEDNGGDDDDSGDDDGVAYDAKPSLDEEGGPSLQTTKSTPSLWVVDPLGACLGGGGMGSHNAKVRGLLLFGDNAVDDDDESCTGAGKHDEHENDDGDEDDGAYAGV